MASIFISYNRKNRPIADALAKDLEALGHSYWLDEQLTGGQRWWDEILTRVRRCDLFVFVLDPDSLESAACTSEYSYAAALGKPILPVRISDQISDGSLPEALSLIQYVDYSEQDRSVAFRLARALNAIEAAPPLPDPLPEAPEVPVSYLGKLAMRVNARSDLSRAEQADLLLELKRKLNDPEESGQTRELLARLRDRDDTLGPIFREINSLLGEAASDFHAARNTPLPSSRGTQTGPAGSGFVSPQPPQTTRGPSGDLGGRPFSPPNYSGATQQTNAPNIPNYLTWAVLSLICCWPLAIPALIHSAQVNGMVSSGDYGGAMASSKKAKNYAMIAIILGIVADGIMIILYLMGMLAAFSQDSKY